MRQNVNAARPKEFTLLVMPHPRRTVCGFKLGSCKFSTPSFGLSDLTHILEPVKLTA